MTSLFGQIAAPARRVEKFRGFSSLYRRMKSGIVVPNESLCERIQWRPRWTREIFSRCDSFAEAISRQLRPDDMFAVDGNLLLNAGINELLQLLIGATAVAFNNTNAQIAVGNSNTAAAATQTDLQGGSIARAGMEATFPSISGQTATWKSSYGSSTANFNWLEVGVQNGAGTPADPVFMLNRKQQDFGTKTSGSTWTMQLSITIT